MYRFARYAASLPDFEIGIIFSVRTDRFPGGSIGCLSFTKIGIIFRINNGVPGNLSTTFHPAGSAGGGYSG
jgi:hypothetical protein